MRIILKPAGVLLVLGTAAALTSVIYAKRKKVEIAAIPTTAPIAAFESKKGKGAAGLYDSEEAMRPVDLTAQGGEDWVHWGLGGPKAVNRKAGGAAQIGPVAFLNPSAGALKEGNRGPSRGFLWSDGAPARSTPKTYDGVFAGGGNGFRFEVPAGTRPRTLDVYVGGYRTGGSFEATAAGAAPLRVEKEDIALEKGYYSRRYTVQVPAGKTGQRVQVVWKNTATEGDGTISLQAAVLR